MPDETNSNQPIKESTDFRKESERLSAENLLLRQQVEFLRLFSEYREKQEGSLQQQKQDIDNQIRRHKQTVNDEINKRLVGMSLLGLVVAGLAWWSTITPVRKLVTDRLDKEFASDNIRVLISKAAQQAAETQTKQLIEGELKPATDEALREIKQQREDVTQFAQQVRQETTTKIGQFQGELETQRVQENAALDKLRQEYSKAVNDLQVLVSYQEKLKGIQLLKGAALFGDAESFNKLDMYSSSDASLNDAAHAAALETKIAYLNSSRVKPVSIWLINPDGSKGLEDDKIPTPALTSIFLLNQKQDWQNRNKAAEFLANRREAEVPPSLIGSFQNDPNLWVKRASLLSFERLTGYAENDVFDFKGAAAWWEKNKDNYLNSLPKK
jgi:hypothetical protein